jgi:hypothetical protein
VRFQRQKLDQIKLQKNNNLIANIVNKKKRNNSNPPNEDLDVQFMFTPLSFEEQSKIQYLTQKIRMHTEKLNQMKLR